MYSCLDLQLNKEYMCTNPLNTNIKIHSHLLSRSFSIEVVGRIFRSIN